MPYTHAINPTLLELGPFEIRFYGIVYALGFFLAYWFIKKAKKQGLLDIQEGDIDNFIIYLALGIILGARLVHVFLWNPSYYLQNPLEILMIWKGGLAFHGGILGGMLVAYWFCKKKNLSFGRVADVLSIPAVFALALGRIANFINGELWGTVTNVNWCVNFKGAEGCRHPSQLYAAFGRFVVLGFLLVLNQKKRKDGFIFWSMFGLLGLSRLIVDFFRENARVIGLSLGQWLSLAMVILTFWVYFKYYRTVEEENEESNESEKTD
tara:strand:- start:4948 stop:5745 length:798 start_codon:yes stop_codon:yes gene_type:complete